jgi:hypothetical protein
MLIQTISQPIIELNAQILFDRPNCLFIGTIVEIREKAVKVDYCLEPIFANGNYNVTVFTNVCWIPKSVLIDDRGSLTVKKWFCKTFTGGNKIKKYFIVTPGQKSFI